MTTSISSCRRLKVRFFLRFTPGPVQLSYVSADVDPYSDHVHTEALDFASMDAYRAALTRDKLPPDLCDTPDSCAVVQVTNKQLIGLGFKGFPNES